MMGLTGLMIWAGWLMWLTQLDGLKGLDAELAWLCWLVGLVRLPDIPWLDSLAWLASWRFTCQGGKHTGGPSLAGLGCTSWRAWQALLAGWLAELDGIRTKPPTIFVPIVVCANCVYIHVQKSTYL